MKSAFELAGRSLVALCPDRETPAEHSPVEGRGTASSGLWGHRPGHSVRGPELGARTEAGGGGAAGRAGCRGRQPRARLSGRFPLRRSKRSTGGGGSGGSRGFTQSSASPPALSSPREQTPERVHLAAAPQAAGRQDRLPFLAVRRQRPAEEPRFLPQETRWLNRCVRARAPWGRGARPVSEGDASVDAPTSLRRPPGGRGFPRERPPCVPPSFFDFVSE